MCNYVNKFENLKETDKYVDLVGFTGKCLSSLTQQLLVKWMLIALK